MFNKFVSGILTATVIMVFSACQKEKVVGEYFLSNDDIATVPYSVGDSIRFVKNNYDTINLLCELRYQEISRYYISHSEYYLYERDVTKLKSDEYSMSWRQSTINMFPSMRITWSGLNTQNHIATFNLPLDSSNLNEGHYYIHEILIRNIWYSDVFVDSVVWTPDPENQESDLKAFFYTKDFGLIKLEFNNGDFWEIDSTSYIQQISDSKEQFPHIVEQSMEHIILLPLRL